MAKAKGTSTQSGGSGEWTAEERAAMKEHAAEIKRAGGKGAAKKADELQALLDKVAEMPTPDREMAERIHSIVTETAPDLEPRTWYGMPAYAQDGKVLLFFQPAAKFKARYSTLGFQDGASLDDGSMWPTSFALTEITEADAKKIAALVKRAVG